MRVAVIADPGPEWDAFVEAEPAGQLGHASAWARIVREAYGLTPVYLEARDEQGAIAGILPLVRFRGLGGGLELVSMPFLDSGGILAQEPATRRALLGTALELTREQGASALELRELAAGDGEPAGQTRVGLVLALESSEDAQWRAVRAKVRNQTRKAENEGLSIAQWNQERLLAGFYEPFCHNMRDLGSPVHS
ncbi:MAG: FemAB-like protein, partial [Myxococcota bacterium]